MPGMIAPDPAEATGKAKQLLTKLVLQCNHVAQIVVDFPHVPVARGQSS